MYISISEGMDSIFFRNFTWWKLNKWCWLFKNIEWRNSLQFGSTSIWLYFYLHILNYLLFLEYSMFFHSHCTCSAYTWNAFLSPIHLMNLFFLPLYPRQRSVVLFSVLVELFTFLWTSRGQKLSNLWHP